MLTRDEAEAFARSWVQAWNDRDIEAVASHYTEDIVYHSPKLASVIEYDGPFLEGKSALVEYWNAAMEGANTLYFEINSIFLSSDAMTLFLQTIADKTLPKHSFSIKIPKSKSALQRIISHFRISVFSIFRPY